MASTAFGSGAATLGVLILLVRETVMGDTPRTKRAARRFVPPSASNSFTEAEFRRSPTTREAPAAIRV